VIKFTNVFKAFPKGGLALKDVSFHIAKGEFVFLTGHSGAGKSTVLKLVYAEEPVTSGAVRVDPRARDAGAHAGGARRQGPRLPPRAVGGRAATRRDRARPRERAHGPARRRAHGQSRRACHARRVPAAA